MMTRFKVAVFLACSITFCFTGCDDGPTSSTDGKTSWLHACDATAQCAGGLVCICGVCTKPCTGSAECSSLGPTAVCGSGNDLTAVCGSDRPSTGLCVAGSEGGTASLPDAGHGSKRDAEVNEASTRDDGSGENDAAPASDGPSNGDATGFSDGSGENDRDAGGSQTDVGATHHDGGTASHDGAVPVETGVACAGDDDHDGVCNDVDRCPGGDDRDDADHDGRPDACEPALLMDINTSNYSSDPGGFTDMGGVAYFMTANGTTASIWRTSPPWTDVSHVADVPKHVDFDLIEGAGVAKWGDRLIVIADERSPMSLVPEYPRQKWTFDLASSAFSPLPDEVPFAPSVKQDGDILYLLQGYPDQRALWRTDGTAAGTVMLGNVNSVVADLGSTLVYFSSPPNVGTRLFRTDGTTGGTYALTDPGNYVIADGYPIAFHGLGYFIQGNGVMGNDIHVWATDGTVAGTQPTFPELPSSLRPLQLAVAGDRLFVKAYPQPGPETIWATPVGGGTLVQLDVPLDVFTMAVSKDAVYASGSGKVYRNDGTSLGFDLVADYPGDLLGDSPILTPTATGFYFVPDWSNLERLDARGVTQLATFEVSFSQPYSRQLGLGLAMDDAVLFAHATVAHGVEPWVTDGTASGTREIADLVTTPAGSTPADFSGGTTAGSDVAFTATTPSVNSVVVARWKTRDDQSSVEQGFVVAADDVFWLTFGDYDFFVRSNFQGPTLIQVNRSTQAAATITSSNVPDSSKQPRIVGSYVLFRTTQQWMSIPAAELTAPVPSLDAAVPFVPSDGEIQGAIGEPLVWSGSTWFVADGRLLRSNGTPTGTARAASANVAEPLVVANDRLYFAASDASAPLEVYRMDAPGTGPTRVTNFASSGDSLDEMLPGSLQGRVFFKCHVGGSPNLCGDTKAGYEAFTDFGGDVSTTVVGDHLLIMDDSQNLWITDGTRSGTKQLLFNAIYNNRKFVLYKGMAYFAAEARGLGVELWRSDGTAAGTYLEADLEPGSGSSFPEQMYAAAEGLYFRASTSANGLEPWVMRH